MNDTHATKTTTRDHCFNCGTTLGLDCGAAEPDYNEDFCSIGCYRGTLAKSEHAHGRIGVLNARISDMAAERDELTNLLNASIVANRAKNAEIEHLLAEIDGTK